MSLLYRMGTGNGSGGDLKPYIVQFTCDSGYIGQTLTMTYKGTPHAGETVDNVSGTVASDGTLTLYPMHSGNWECSCYSSVTGTTMKKTIELSYWGTTNVEFNDIPDGATFTPTDDVQTWLHCANIWNKSYTTISEVVADITTLNILISDNNASDYLARSTTWASDVCSNESAMTYIGNNNYCANKLLDNDTWLTAICNSTYFEKVLNVKVPTMTSNTTPSGEAVASSQYDTSYGPYKAFDGDTSTLAAPGLNNSICWLGYYFPSNVRVNRTGLKNRTQGSCRVKKFTLQAFDGIEWKNISDSIENPTGDALNFFNVSNSIYYNKYRILIAEVENSEFWANVATLQFYGREEA